MSPAKKESRGGGGSCLKGMLLGKTDGKRNGGKKRRHCFPGLSIGGLEEKRKKRGASQAITKGGSRCSTSV